MPLPNEGSEGTKGAKAKSLIEPDGAVVQAGRGQRYFTEALTLQVVKTTSEQGSPYTSSLELHAHGDLRKMRGFPPYSGSAQDSRQLARRTMECDKRRLAQKFPATVMIDYIL